MVGVRNIIVEGPDGSGKSTLVNHLQEKLGMGIARRASESASGPVPDLAGWHEDEKLRMSGSSSEPLIYDRHPLFSEPIYAPLAREVRPQPPFDEPGWVSLQRDYLSRFCILVLCLPPQWVVKHNVTRGGVQMPGVTSNIVKIFNAYDAFRRNNAWPTHRLYHYDYTNRDRSGFVLLGIYNAMRAVTRV